MKNTITILGLLLLFTSCGVYVNDINFNRRNYDNVPLNQILSNEIGDKLITKGQEDYQKAYRIVNTQTFKINTVNYPYTKGDILPLAGETKQWFLYFDKRKMQANYDHIGIAENKKTGEVKPFISSMAGFYAKNVPDFEVEEDTFTDNNCNDCFKQEFVFNGKVDNNLKFMYREYINDMARPAFNQELQYDLNESSIIGFKGLRLEVIKATNTKIDYKVLSSFK